MPLPYLDQYCGLHLWYWSNSVNEITLFGRIIPSQTNNAAKQTITPFIIFVVPFLLYRTQKGADTKTQRRYSWRCSWFGALVAFYFNL